MALSDDQLSRFRAVYAGRWCCVTGGAGFIGGHLAEHLLRVGANVSVIDDLSNSDGKFITDLVDLEPARVRLVFGSILDPTALADAMEDCSYVFHMAAMGSVPRSIEQPERCMAVNSTGTVRVAEAARQAGVDRWVYSASSSAYGDAQALPKSEDQPVQPLSPYAASKLAGEAVVRAWAASYGLSGVSLRYFNIFGSRQSADSAYAAVVAAFITRLLQGKSPVIHGDGSYSRDFTHVSNAVYANLLAGAAPEELRGQVVNVGCGGRTTILELVRLLAEILDREDVRVEHAPARVGDVPHSQAAISRARELLGYEPVTSLEAGLRETASWFERRLTKATPA